MSIHVCAGVCLRICDCVHVFGNEGVRDHYKVCVSYTQCVCIVFPLDLVFVLALRWNG